MRICVLVPPPAKEETKEETKGRDKWKNFGKALRDEWGFRERITFLVPSTCCCGAAPILRSSRRDVLRADSPNSSNLIILAVLSYTTPTVPNCGRIIHLDCSRRSEQRTARLSTLLRGGLNNPSVNVTLWTKRRKIETFRNFDGRRYLSSHIRSIRRALEEL